MGLYESIRLCMYESAGRFSEWVGLLHRVFAGPSVLRPGMLLQNSSASLTSFAGTLMWLKLQPQVLCSKQPSRAPEGICVVTFCTVCSVWGPLPLCGGFCLLCICLCAVGGTSLVPHAPW